MSASITRSGSFVLCLRLARGDLASQGRYGYELRQVIFAHSIVDWRLHIGAHSIKQHGISSWKQQCQQQDLDADDVSICVVM